MTGLLCNTMNSKKYRARNFYNKLALRIRVSNNRMENLSRVLKLVVLIEKRMVLLLLLVFSFGDLRDECRNR